MKNILAIIASFVFATTSITNVMAAEEGIYGLLSAGVTPVSGATSTTYSLGLSLGGGYNFNKHVGIEGQFALLGMATSNVLNAHVLAVTVNGYLPVQERFNVFVKAGKSYTTITDGKPDASISQSAMNNVYGYGLEFSSDDQKKYRLGVDHYVLSTAPGMSLSTNYINLSVVTNF
jgi:hypothetical protein